LRDQSGEVASPPDSFIGDGKNSATDLKEIFLRGQRGLQEVDSEEYVLYIGS